MHSDLSFYKDKLLQFKRKKVFVINTAGDYEFLEDTFENIGVKKQASVVTTQHGVAWVNKSGCYIYDGKELFNLIDNKIPTKGYQDIANNFWFTSNDNTHSPVIGYMQEKDSLLVKFNDGDHSGTSAPEGATYHFPTESWSFVVQGFAGDTQAGTSGAISNMITDENGDILYARYKSGATTVLNSIKKWNHESSVYSATTAAKIFYFTTKDFTFGDIAARKKLYKVYITYKVGTDGTDSGVTVYGAVNGSNDFTAVTFNASTSVFGGTATACYAGSTLDETDGIWKTAELKFSSSSVVNNIYSFQLRFQATAIPADFEVNDLSIVYRAKSVK